MGSPQQLSYTPPIIISNKVILYLMIFYLAIGLIYNHCEMALAI